MARATVHTGTWIAVVDVGLTVVACKARPTRTDVASQRVGTAASILARVGYTLINIHLTDPTLPSVSAGAHKVLVVRGVVTEATVPTRVGRAGNQDVLTVFSCIRQLTLAGVTSNPIHAHCFVQAWVRGTIVDIELAVLASKALLAFTDVSIHQVRTAPSILAWVGVTLVLVNATVHPSPPRFAVTLVPIDVVVTRPVHAGTAATFVHLGVAQGVVVALGAQAGEAVLAVDARAPVLARTRRTLVDLDVALRAHEARFADAVVAVDAIPADAVITRLAGTVVMVDLTVDPCS